MNEKNFMKQISEYKMPDISEVRKICLEQLNENDKEQHTSAYFPKIAVIAMLVICLFSMPIKSLAVNIAQHIKAMLELNNEAVELGNVDETQIQIPDDCEEVTSDGVTYLSKAYHTLPDLTKDIQADIYTWRGTDNFFDNGIMLNIIQNDYGRIALLYDVTHNKAIDKDTDTIDLQSVDMFIYFPLSPKSSLGNIMLQNDQLKYSTIDDEGNVEKYEQNTEYQLVEQYKSTSLNTTVTVISSKSDTAANGDLEEITETDTTYYLYFTLEGMCYQINCVGTLDKAHAVLENMKKTDVLDSVSQSSEN